MVGLWVCGGDCFGYFEFAGLVYLCWFMVGFGDVVLGLLGFVACCFLWFVIICLLILIVFFFHLFLYVFTIKTNLMDFMFLCLVSLVTLLFSVCVAYCFAAV